MPTPRRLPPAPTALLPLLLALALQPACASAGPASGAASQKEQAMVAMQGRLEELERTNGRLGARVEELEDQVFLLHDRVESARMMLRRRHVTGRPRPTAQTAYQESDLPPAMDTRPSSRRPIVRLSPQTPPAPSTPEADPPPLKEEFEGEVVMTNEAFEQLYGTSTGGAGRGGTSSPPSSSSRGAQPPVTDQKIALLDSGSTPRTSSPAAGVTGIKLYKDSLSKYRSGQYADALRGFESFLAAAPKADYVDNALYWIGECQYGLSDYAGAVGTFGRLLGEQPEGNKVPDAMLKMAMALEKMGQMERSKKVLLDLTAQFPTTAAAKLGQRRLDS